MKTPRQIAAEALLRVERGGYSQLTLDAALSSSPLLPRDAGFAAALFYTVLERKLTLDACIARYARHPLTDTVAVALRLGLAQLLYFDSVPAHAAVDESVRLARALNQRAAAPMVNGILRSFLRDGCRLPPVEGDSIRRLSVEYSCGEEIVSLLLGWHGEQQTRAVLAASLGRPPLFVRVNRLKTDAGALEGLLETQGCRVLSRRLDGDCLELSGEALRAAAHAEGLFHVQDLSSQKAALTLEAAPGERVLDACAAPGSKSFLMAQQMQNRGTVVACDAAPGRAKLIEQGAKRLGVSILSVQTRDAAELDPALGEFDAVLCDVPCSGFGVLRRKPEMKYRGVKPLDALPQLQYKILKTSAQYLRSGGRLVYSTCTLNPAENEEVVGRFLREHPAFSLDGAGMETIFPEAGGGDGFFIAALRRNA